MVTKRIANSIVLIIASIGFIYRLAITLRNIFPPGADIGLHQSVINSILSPKTTFFYNYYHMGGGISVTNPGYHIFCAFLTTMTGASDYVVQAVVASLFSALIIMSTFLVVKLVWGELAGIVVAVLVTFSASDIIMLSWAGYPNIVTLALIPLLFYLFLQPEKLSQKNYLVLTSIVTFALFLTHVFSAIVFVTLTICALVVNFVFKKSTGFSKKTAFSWLIPMLFGFILASPYLLGVIPIYLFDGAMTGAVSVMKQAVVETRVVPTMILIIAIIPILLFLIFSKKGTGKFLTPSSVLFASAILVPLVAAQCYLFGFFLDYERFLYFLAFPVLVCIGLVIVRVPKIIVKGLQKSEIKIPGAKVEPILISLFLIICLVTPLFALPYSVVSADGFEEAEFFQVMNSNRYQAVQWLKDNTTPDSVIISDANMGWWISGFSKRQTLSAVDPQYLILQREFEPAQVASNFIEADYIVDNGLLQIQQAGAYANGSTHEIFAISNSSIIKPLVCSLDDTQISILYRDNGIPKEVKLGAFTDTSTHVADDLSSASFIISRSNGQFKVTEEITLYQGSRFAKVTFVFENFGHNNFDWIRIPFTSRGQLIEYDNSVGIVDNISHLINQLVFPDSQLGIDVLLEESPNNYELIFNLKGSNSTTQVNYFVGLCPFNTQSRTNPIEFYNGLIKNNTDSYLDSVSDKKIVCFDYRKALVELNISYLVVRDLEVVARYSNDPMFKVAFQNTEVTIFKVDS